jgi:hypothetical protein
MRKNHHLQIDKEIKLENLSIVEQQYNYKTIKLIIFKIQMKNKCNKKNKIQFLPKRYLETKVLY